MSDRHGKPVPRSLAVLSIITLAIFIAGTAQQSPQQPPLKYEVSVTLKLIQVYVTDKNGKPVRDLTKDEFKLTDNGKPVTLSAFEKHDLAAAPTAGVEAPAPDPAAAPEPAVAPVLNRKFVILFDFAFNTGHGIVAGVKAAQDFLDYGGPAPGRAGLRLHFDDEGREDPRVPDDRPRQGQSGPGQGHFERHRRKGRRDRAGLLDDCGHIGRIPGDQPRRGGPDPLDGPGAAQFHAADGELFQGPDDIRPGPAAGPRAKKRPLLFNGGAEFPDQRDAKRGNGPAESIRQRRLHVDGDRIPGRGLHAAAAPGNDAEGVQCFELFDLRLRHTGVLQTPGALRLRRDGFPEQAVSGGLLGADTGGIFRDDKTTGMDSLREPVEADRREVLLEHHPPRKEYG